MTAVGAGVGVYLLYRYYKSRQSASSAATAPASSNGTGASTGATGFNPGQGGGGGGGGGGNPFLSLLEQIAKNTTPATPTPNPTPTTPTTTTATAPAGTTAATTAVGTLTPTPVTLSAGGVVPSTVPNAPGTSGPVAPVQNGAVNVSPNTGYVPVSAFNSAQAKAGKYFYLTQGGFVQYQPGKSKLPSGTQLYSAKNTTSTGSGSSGF